MEGEEESSLDVTGDEIDLGYEERPVNCYGSPIALPESTDHEEAGPSQALPGRVICQSASARILAAEKQENIGDVCAGMPLGDTRRVVYKTEHKSMKQGLSKFAV